MVLIRRQPAGNEADFGGARGSSMGMPTPMNAEIGMASPRSNEAGSETPLFLRWAKSILYLAIAISWAGAVYNNSSLRAADLELEDDELIASMRRDQTFRMLQDANEAAETMRGRLIHLARTHRNFEHELKMDDEVHESHQEHARQLNAGGGKAPIAMTWIEERHAALEEKLTKLKKSIQEQDHKEILERYGPGTHRVRFNVKTPTSEELQFFVVETAPVDLMPHAILRFLEMVSSKVWDNTIFYYHPKNYHVIPTAAVQHGTFQHKDHFLEQLGFTGSGFGEYSNEYPHKKYTIGFSDRGASFYINTIDNTKHHGPGAQDHHKLSSEADSCFATIVEGSEVVDQMRTSRTNRAKGNPVSWKDYDVTHIVSIEILDD